MACSVIQERHDNCWRCCAVLPHALQLLWLVELAPPPNHIGPARQQDTPHPMPAAPLHGPNPITHRTLASTGGS